MEKWQTVYDFADRFPNWGLMAWPVLFAAAGMGQYLYSKRSASEAVMPGLGVTKRGYGMFMGLVLATLAGVGAAVSLPASLGRYFRAKAAYTAGHYRTVEGAIDHFVPMPKTGHKNETFTVAGVPFAFSDFDALDYGYHNAASHGGAARQGRTVRIGYFNNGEKNVILKLETAAAGAPLK